MDSSLAGDFSGIRLVFNSVTAVFATLSDLVLLIASDDEAAVVREDCRNFKAAAPNLSEAIDLVLANVLALLAASLHAAL